MRRILGLGLDSWGVRVDVAGSGREMDWAGCKVLPVAADPIAQAAALSDRRAGRDSPPTPAAVG